MLHRLSTSCLVGSSTYYYYSPGGYTLVGGLWNNILADYCGIVVKAAASYDGGTGLTPHHSSCSLSSIYTYHPSIHLKLRYIVGGTY